MDYDLIYTDAYGRELGIAKFYEGDFTIGRHNDFELKIPKSIGITQNCYLMIDETEYGGVVDGVERATFRKHDIASGRTWHGILESSILMPDSGQRYVVVSGELNGIAKNLISRQGLDFCFAADSADSGFRVTNYICLDFEGNRYADFYSALRRMAKSVGAKLKIRYDGALRKAVLSFVPIGDYVDDGLDGDRAEFVISTTRPYNEAIALGPGEYENRMVLRVFADADGNVGDKQTIFGVGRKAKVYDNPNAEDREALHQYAIDWLKDLQKDLKSCSITGAVESKYDIDDIVGAISIEDGERVITTIAEKVAAKKKGKNLRFTTKTALEN